MGSDVSGAGEFGAPPLELPASGALPPLEDEEPLPVPVLPVLLVPVVAPPASHTVTQPQVSPGAQSGQAVTQVPGVVQALPPSSQLHAQGLQLAPGGQASQAQLQAPPEPPEPPPEQSHSTEGQSAPSGQARGLTQAQSVPS